MPIWTTNGESEILNWIRENYFKVFTSLEQRNWTLISMSGAMANVPERGLLQACDFRM
jgi:hypothetical protein